MRKKRSIRRSRLSRRNSARRTRLPRSRPPPRPRHRPPALPAAQGPRAPRRQGPGRRSDPLLPPPLPLKPRQPRPSGPLHRQYRNGSRRRGLLTANSASPRAVAPHCAGERAAKSERRANETRANISLRLRQSTRDFAPSRARRRRRRRPFGRTARRIPKTSPAPPRRQSRREPRGRSPRRRISPRSFRRPKRMPDNPALRRSSRASRTRRSSAPPPQCRSTTIAWGRGCGPSWKGNVRKRPHQPPRKASPGFGLRSPSFSASFSPWRAPRL